MTGDMINGLIFNLQDPGPVVSRSQMPGNGRYRITRPPSTVIVLPVM